MTFFCHILWGDDNTLNSLSFHILPFIRCRWEIDFRALCTAVRCCEPTVHTLSNLHIVWLKVSVYMCVCVWATFVSKTIHFSFSALWKSGKCDLYNSFLRVLPKNISFRFYVCEQCAPSTGKWCNLLPFIAAAMFCCVPACMPATLDSRLLGRTWKEENKRHKSANANDSHDNSPPHRLLRQPRCQNSHTINGMKTFFCIFHYLTPIFVCQFGLLPASAG